MAELTCSIAGCDQPPYARGWCIRHYRRWLIHGRADHVLVPQRFWLLVDFRGDCWEWSGKIHAKGYGLFQYRAIHELAHRLAWELLVGPVPPGLHLDHLCRNLICVNPDHLEPVPPRTNALRGYSPAAQQARRTHCRNGHLYTEANTYLDRRGKRLCRLCRRTYQQVWQRSH